MRTPHGTARRPRPVRPGPRLVLIAAVASAVAAVGATAACGPGGGQKPASSAMDRPQALRDTAPPAVVPGDAPGSDPASGVAPPAGNQIQDVLRAEGALVYRCSAGKYTLAQTSMKLFVENGGFAGTQSALLSWRFKNGTQVDAALVKQVPHRNTVSQALFKVVAVHGGDANDRATTFIVRQPMSGGLPPAGCTTSGERLAVPFTTRYVFYRSG
ncbi:MAG TPA: hypothetical protein VI248_25000 [Kineosporiaceae bacterium]